MENPLTLYSFGAIASSGLSAKEIASSVRAGLRNCEQAESWLGKRTSPIAQGRVPDGGLFGLADAVKKQAGLSSRAARLLRLAGTALKNDLIPGAPMPVLYFVLPEHDGGSAVDGKEFLAQLSLQTGEVFFDIDNSRSDFRGRAGGAHALAQAVGYTHENPEKFILIGAADTFDDPVLLHRLDMQDRLKTDENLDGFTPGEGGGFLLVGRADAGKQHGMEPIAQIGIPATAHESGHLYSDQPYRGDGLAEAMHSLFASSPPGAPIRDIYCTMNGESYWAKEWGVALNRNRAHFASDALVHHPAENFGDIGAAFGPVLIALAAIGIAKGYRQSPVLVYTSSDYGDRAATLVSAVA